jgi:GAF domain-containing protein
MVLSEGEMPYFIKPSVKISGEDKVKTYHHLSDVLKEQLKGEDDIILKMATFNALAKTYLPYYYWVGFYLVKNGRLTVGPYQGTAGCLHIDFSKGVCGKVAREGKACIVPDTHLLSEGSEHITCDAHSRSEIVVPVFNRDNKLFAVLDVDSTEVSAFDDLDSIWLSSIVSLLFKS